MKNYPDRDPRARSTRARQVISGEDLRSQAPLSTRSVAYQEEGPFSSPQWIYMGVLVALIALAVILYLVTGGGVASVFFFLLSLALFAGWFMF
ncbi:hypothetical protein BH24CHL4_BH24CHL4_26070 [soil metagenome]